MSSCREDRQTAQVVASNDSSHLINQAPKYLYADCLLSLLPPESSREIILQSFEACPWCFIGAIVFLEATLL